jgi:hypothetical protein
MPIAVLTRQHFGDGTDFILFSYNDPADSRAGDPLIDSMLVHGVNVREIESQRTVHSASPRHLFDDDRFVSKMQMSRPLDRKVSTSKKLAALEASNGTGTGHPIAI